MSAKQKILIVDDDTNIAELISLYLIKECFETKIVEDGIEAIQAVSEFNPDLILLDLMLPGMDGYEVCKTIRKTSCVPIIILSAKGEVFDKVLGLELGADDYVMKPFDSKELVARVKAVLRRAPSKQEEITLEKKEQLKTTEETIVKYPDLEINLTKYSIVYCKNTIELTRKELELLYFLASHPNHVFNREQLLEQVWGYDYIGDTRTIDVHIKRLREKIKDGQNWRIATVWGIGYKFEVIG